MSKQIRIEIVHTGGPYPSQCWWRIIGSNGRIIVSSETMGLQNARRMTKKLINDIINDRYCIKERDEHGKLIRH